MQPTSKCHCAPCRAKEKSVSFTGYEDVNVPILMSKQFWESANVDKALVWLREDVSVFDNATKKKRNIGDVFIIPVERILSGNLPGMVNFRICYEFPEPAGADYSTMTILQVPQSNIRCIQYL